MAESLFAIDASIYIFRYYFAQEPRWQSEEGFSTEAVYGFARFLINLLERERPSFIAAAFDESLGTGFRHRLFPGYKANRTLPDDALAYQFSACREVSELLGIRTYGCSEYEADDYLAACVAAADPAHKVMVVSADKDLCQLLSPNTSLWDYGRKTPLTEQQFLQQRGIPPQLMTDLLALTGDASDSIPGVPGVGVKTATAILQKLGAIEEWLDNLSLLQSVPVRGSGTLKNKVAPVVDQIQLAKKLVQLHADIPTGPTLSQLQRKPVSLDRAAFVFQQLGIGELIPRLEKLKPCL